MTVGNRIRLKRIEMGLTQDELAKKMGFKSRSAIANIEKREDNKIYRDTVEKYAAALNCTPEELMGWSDTNYKNTDTDLISDIIKDTGTLKLVKLFTKLNNEHQASIIEQIEFYINKENKGK